MLLFHTLTATTKRKWRWKLKIYLLYNQHTSFKMAKAAESYFSSLLSRNIFNRSNDNVDDEDDEDVIVSFHLIEFVSSQIVPYQRLTFCCVFALYDDFFRWRAGNENSGVARLINITWNVTHTAICSFGYTWKVGWKSFAFSFCSIYIETAVTELARMQMSDATKWEALNEITQRLYPCKIRFTFNSWCKNPLDSKTSCANIEWDKIRKLN